MKMFWELFSESLIIQGVLAIMFSVVVCAMYLMGMAVPQELIALISLILGYFFGAKTQVAAQKTARMIHDASNQEEL
jgi:hypothetical protein